MSCGSFLQGNVDKYAWVGKGGSFVMSEINAAVLHAQLESRVMINAARMQVTYMNMSMLCTGGVHEYRMTFTAWHDHRCGMHTTPGSKGSRRRASCRDPSSRRSVSTTRTSTTFV